MDDLTRQAVAAIPFDDHDQAQRWLDAVRGTGGVTNEILRDDQREAFDRYLADHGADPEQIIANLLTEPDIGVILSEGDGTGAYDESSWFAYLRENGQYWDGTEENWPAFRDWFVHHAAESGAQTPAGHFIAYLEACSDKVAAFAEYGIAVPGAPESPDVQSAEEAEPVGDVSVEATADADKALEDAGIDVPALLNKVETLEEATR